MVETTKMVGVRVSIDLHGILTKVSTNRGENLSDFVRRAILKELASLNYLPPEQMKALGINYSGAIPPCLP